MGRNRGVNCGTLSNNFLQLTKSTSNKKGDKLISSKLTTVLYRTAPRQLGGSFRAETIYANHLSGTGLC